MADKPDIVITISGGCVNGVFGPEGTTVLLIDYDNINDGDMTWGVGKVDDTVDSKACRDSIKEAEEITDKNERLAAIEAKAAKTPGSDPKNVQNTLDNKNGSP